MPITDARVFSKLLLNPSVLRILILCQHEPAGVPIMAKAIGMGTATCYRLVQEMVREELLAEDGRTLGPTAKWQVTYRSTLMPHPQAVSITFDTNTGALRLEVRRSWQRVSQVAITDCRQPLPRKESPAKEWMGSASE